nr:hypothetical protein [Cytophagales bacterium]
MNVHPNTPTFGMPLRGLLLVAGIYTFVWGAFFKWFGSALLQWLSMDAVVDDLATNTFGTFGMVVGVVIFLSAFYPLSWFYLIVAGAAGKAISTGWFLILYSDIVGWNKRSIFHVTFNELLWLILLLIILYKANKTKTYVKSLPAEK